MKKSYLFVYGTLMQHNGHGMHQLLKTHAEFICDAWCLGKLYQIDYYPGLIESTNKHDKVYGELYLLHEPERVLTALDDYEQCSQAFPQPHEYLRKQLSAHCSGGDTYTAWAYIYNHSVITSKRLLSGYFKQR